ncbi:hypothetical protein [Polyangium aurulentum]|uniref:hypothetical protein n=1 Tax=Polyangium aurulentum TaxID=2567896 RepID=UPI0010ADCBB2|nr:hypothetical protein [Polyangium aurulentum]UQA56228.1 hypothetical protein E8A73_033660 [Polyangium aurulentum]
MRSTRFSRSPSLAVVLGALLVGAVACGPTTRFERASGGGEGGGDASSTTAGAGAGVSWDGPLEDLAEGDLGNVLLNEPTAFPVPDRALGLTVLVEAPKVDDIIGIAKLAPPTGGDVIFDYAMAEHATTVFANYGWIGGGNPQADSAAAWPMQQGTWTIQLGDDDGSSPSARVRVWVRRTEDGAFHGGVVDVNVFLIPGVASQNYVLTVLGEMFASYAGLGLGNVTFHPLDASSAIIGSYDEYQQMLASSAGIGATPALNLFVIDHFSPDTFGGAIGVAGGIPGSPMRHGTTLSGIAYAPQGNPQYDATILRHELGHLAGLFHTTEAAVEETDPLSDTAACTMAMVNANPDACPDATNTMFPYANGATDLTPAQERVLQGSAMYRGVLKAGGQPAPPSPFAPPHELDAKKAITVRRTNKPLPLHPTPLERMLGAVWCTHGGKADHEALAIRIAGPEAPAALRAIAVDEDKADILRSRALRAYLRAAKGKERARAIDLADGIARRETASSDLRISALEALGREDPSRARAVAKATGQSEDTVVRAVALGLLTK